MYNSLNADVAENYKSTAQCSVLLHFEAVFIYSNFN